MVVALVHANRSVLTLLGHSTVNVTLAMPCKAMDIIAVVRTIVSVSTLSEHIKPQTSMNAAQMKDWVHVIKFA